MTPLGAAGISWYSTAAPTAHVQSLINRYPQVNGVIIDGPGENHYELALAPRRRTL